MKRLFDKVGKKKEKDGSLVGKVVLVGQFSVRVEAIVGEGGFATIYRVTDMKTGHLFALKHMRLGADSDAIKEVQREAKTMARLKGHPNILKLHAVAFAGPQGAETDGFMLLDFCPVTLLEVMQRSNFVLDDFLVYEVFQDVVWAVAHMHKCNPPLAHRDLKAENVLKNSEGRWVICDFGSATTRAQVYDTPAEIAMEEDNIRRTTTPAYRAPEMWDLYSRQRIDTAVDVWALGVLLYVLAFGKLPFQGDSKLSILYGKYELPTGRPPAMRSLIQDMLQVNPADRPDIVQVISKLDLLRNVLSSEPCVSDGGAADAPAPSSQAPPAPPAPAVAAPLGSLPQQQPQAPSYPNVHLHPHLQPSPAQLMPGHQGPLPVQAGAPAAAAARAAPTPCSGGEAPQRAAIAAATSQRAIGAQQPQPATTANGVPSCPQALPPGAYPQVPPHAQGHPQPQAHQPHPYPYPGQPHPQPPQLQQPPHPGGPSTPPHPASHQQPYPQVPGHARLPGAPPRPDAPGPCQAAPGPGHLPPPGLQRLPSRGQGNFTPSWPTVHPVHQVPNLMDETYQQPAAGPAQPPLPVAATAQADSTAVTSAALATPARQEALRAGEESALGTMPQRPSAAPPPGLHLHKRTGSFSNPAAARGLVSPTAGRPFGAAAGIDSVGFGDDNVDWGEHTAFGATSHGEGAAPERQQQRPLGTTPHGRQGPPVELMSMDSPPAALSVAAPASSSSAASPSGRGGRTAPPFSPAGHEAAAAAAAGAGRSPWLSAGAVGPAAFPPTAQHGGSAAGAAASGLPAGGSGVAQLIGSAGSEGNAVGTAAAFLGGSGAGSQPGTSSNTGNEVESLKAQLHRLAAHNAQLEGRVRQLEGTVAAQGALVTRLTAEMRALQQQQQSHPLQQAARHDQHPQHQAQHDPHPQQQPPQRQQEQLVPPPGHVQLAQHSEPAGLRSAVSDGTCGIERTSGPAVAVALPSGGPQTGLSAGGGSDGLGSGSWVHTTGQDGSGARFDDGEPWRTKLGDQVSSPSAPYPPLRYEDLS